MFIPLPECVNEADKERANYALQFNKWVCFEGSYDNPTELKGKKTDEFVRLKKAYEDKKSTLHEMADTYRKRTVGMLSALKNKGFAAEIVTCKVSDALVCGIGDEHPLENSLRLDHCTGLPCIPASSVKGVVKFAAEFDENKDTRAKDKEEALFGTQKCVGQVQFLDGAPVRVPALKIDIMNNHFPDYYSDPSRQRAPSDDMDPNPIPFMVVDSDSEFYFPVVTKTEEGLKRAVEFLRQALSEWGVGAKSSVGYGLFYDFGTEPVEAAKPTMVQKPEPACQIALEALKMKASPENFVKLIQSLTPEDEKWLKAQDLFSIPNFNKGFADKLVEIVAAPENIRKVLAKAFLDTIDLKEAKKRAAKGDRKDLDRYEKLKGIIGRV